MQPEEPEPEPQPVPPPVTRRSLARDACLDLALALLAGGGLILAGATLGIAANWGSPTSGPADLMASGWGIAALLVATQVPLVYFGWRRRRRNREKLRELPALFAGDSSTGIRQGLTAGLAMTVLSMLYTGALQRVAGPESVENQLAFLKDLLDNRAVTALLVLVIAGMAPVCEEFFFRGVVFGSARAAGYSQVGMWLSAALFAFVHVSPLLVPFYATFAVVMCWLYARTGTLAAPITAHMVLNGVACAALLIAGPDAV